MPQPFATHGLGDGLAFEAEVLRIARLLYPKDPYGGSTIIDGAERDGIFVTEDLVVVIEATTGGSREKAEKDGRKLKALVESLSRQYPLKAVKGFFVTRDEPSAYQRDAIKAIGGNVTAVGFDQFRKQLIDVKEYLEARSDFVFGSARDPETDEYKVTDKYVALNFLNAEDTDEQHQLDSIFDRLSLGLSTVLIGDFGTGKSMTLRELFIKFRNQYYRTTTTEFAVHLNLNQHQGQTDPAEALTRHAQMIGYSAPHKLIRAWRSGDVHVLLDGFDEVYASNATAVSRPISDIRRASLELVRRFVDETQSGAGVVIAGRAHYFDSIEELRTVLGIAKGTLVATASEFTDSQVQEYLLNRKWKRVLPDWLPRRPLIIGYLAGRRLFEEFDDSYDADKGEGWDRLIDAICLREARAESGLDAASIRAVLEKLSTLARRTSSGLGPLDFQDLVSVYRDLKGYLPDVGAYGVLQRLPGMRVSNGQTNTRSFVDDDLADAVRAGEVFGFVQDPFREGVADGFVGAQNLLGPVGLEVVRYRAEQANVSAGVLQTAIRKAQDRGSAEALEADVIRVGMLMGFPPSRPMIFAGMHFPSMSLSGEADYSQITMSDCIVDVLDISDVENPAVLPTFTNCYIGLVEGAAALSEAADKFHGTAVGEFGESTENQTSILKLNISESRRVAIMILRKIFVQSGHSRKESAFYRGSLTRDQRELVPQILDNLHHAGVIRRIRRRDSTLWEPNRTLYMRVKKLLEAPGTSTDEIIARF